MRGVEMSRRKNNKSFNLFLTVIVLILFLVYGYLFQGFASIFSPQATLPTLESAQLFVEPDDGRSYIIDAIDNAKESVDLEVYILSDSKIISALINAKNRGAVVRVILEESPYLGYGANKETKNKLAHYGVDVKWSNRVYKFTHSKFFVTDKVNGYILTLNLSKSAFTKNREFGVIIRDSISVGELEKIFQADWDRKPYKVAESPLVVSPENARIKLENLIKGAEKEILVYAEVMNDADFEKLLVTKAQSGVSVCVILADPAAIDSNAGAYERFLTSKIQVSICSTPFTHAKAILVDDSAAYIGSINFSTTSFDKNREVGIIVSSPEVISKLKTTFLYDFRP